MSNTVTKSPLKSTNFWAGILTVVTGGFAFFAISPDLDSASVLANEAHRAVEAISTKNYTLLFTVVVNAGNILYHLFWKK